MSLLPNIFSDDKLRTRQIQLDGQWSSLWARWQSCDSTPDSAFAEFASDRKGWIEFFDSGSDWSDDSKKATDIWQQKAQEWSNKLSSWCGGGTSSGIPSVKDPPPDDPTLIMRITGGIKDVADIALKPAATIGWVAVAIFVLVLLTIVWIVTKGRAKAFGVELGGQK